MKTLEELRARQKEITALLEQIDKDAEGRSLGDDKQAEWDALDKEYDENRSEIGKLEAREQRLAQVRAAHQADEDEKRTEPGSKDDTRGGFNTNVGGRLPEDIHDLDAYRSRARSEEDMRDMLRDGAMKAADRAVFPHPDVTREAAQEHIELLLERHAGDGKVAQIILSTGSREYRRAFGKAISGAPLTNEEHLMLARAASLSDAAGGYAVPFTLDPTVILTSNGAVNPFREIARIETTTTDNWNGVTSAGITAAYAGEAVEVADGAPTLAQPSVTVEKAHAFVPFSIEIGQDWGAFQSEMAMMLADGKDVLEESKFTTGGGHSSTAPEGIITGATVTVNTATTAVLALADIYSPVDQLPARWEARASWLGNKKTFNKVKQLAQALSGGNVGIWADLAGGAPARLLDAPVYKGTTIVSTLTTSSSKVLVYGDFKQFLIVDRIGMSVELVPHLFATANNLPSGQRGLYAYWRNSSKVLVPGAFRVLNIL